MILESSIQVVKEALSQHDMVITTGGVSVGDFDYLPEIYKAINADVLFNKAAQRPGSVTTVAFANGQYLFDYLVILQHVLQDLNFTLNLL